MVIEPLLNHAARNSNDLAVRDETGAYTYAQLAAMSAGIAAVVSAKTQKPNVGLLLPSSAGFVASFYGTLLAGKTVVPINFLLSEREVAHVLKDSGVDTVITIPPLAEKIKSSGLQIIDLTQLPRPTSVALPSPPAKSPTDLAVIMYTSGTSGLPKGVMLSYQNLHSDTECSIQHAKLEGRYKFLGIIPLFHSTGMLATMLAPITLGAMTIYQARFSHVAVMKSIKEDEINVIAAVPSMWNALNHLKHAGPDDVKTLQVIISGGEPLPANIREAFLTKYGKPIYEGYGLTETIGPIAFNIMHAHRPGSVGKIIPCVEVRLVDDNGKDVPPGGSGEIWLKGPMIMQGYYHLPELTAQAITPDGFFKTGDSGRFDSDGFLYITGRKKELIIIAGENVAPREIEELLIQEPTVAEAAVVGRKDASRGEAVVAFVIAKEGMEIKPEELRTHLRGMGLAQFKIPKEFFIVKDLPRSPTGKVLKRVLAEQVNKATE